MAPTVQTFCSPLGTVCEFIGRRPVTLVASNGVTHTEQFYGSVPCAATGYARGFQQAPTAPYTHCEINAQMLDTRVNPMPGMFGLKKQSLRIPAGDFGLYEQLVRNDGSQPAPAGGEGNFRMTCTLAKMDFFDPIVSPGIANTSHLHMFFGNADITPSATPSVLRTSGRGTCGGGSINRTGYWVPALFDRRNSQIVTPDYAIIYYKTGYNVDPATIQNIPAGLMMIAGDKSNSSGVQIRNLLEVVAWGCEQRLVTNTGAVPDCPVGDVVTLQVSFPQCWNGTQLDSPDHQSHMAYPIYRNPPLRSVCPATHPVVIPIITEIFRWPVTPGMSSSFWRLTSDNYAQNTAGGFSAHADWMNGWTQEFLQTIVEHCLRPGKDCGVHLLGDGRTLY